MDSLFERLRKLECPFNWNLERVLTKQKGNLRDKLLRKLGTDMKKDQTLEEPVEDTDYNSSLNGSLAWQKCSQYLTIAWLDYRKSYGEEYLVKTDSFITNVKGDVPFIARYVKALEYVTTAMWAHVHYERGETERAEDRLGSIATSFQDMEDTHKASVKALKSCVLMEFGPAGHAGGALEAIEEALALVDKEAEWHFLKGKCLGRERRARNHKSVPSEEELFHLRTAVAMDKKTASHYAFCGLSVKEYAFNSPLARSNRKLQLELAKECEELMTQAAILNNDSPSVLSRIAKGLMPLKSESASELIQRCVLRSLELLPDSGLVNHVAGNFHMFKKHDYERAVFHLNIAALERGLFGAYINLMDIRWTMSSDNIDPLVDSFWQKFKDDSYNGIKALPVMANYHFFVKNNLVEAISYWRRWMRSRRNFAETSLFVQCGDMTKALVGQTLCELRSNSTLSTDNEAIFRSFQEEVFEQRGLDISRIDTDREKVIRAALSKLDIKTRRVVEPKLPLSQFGNIPSSKRPQTTRARRQLPQNWRQR